MNARITTEEIALADACGIDFHDVCFIVKRVEQRAREHATESVEPREG